MPGLFSRRVKNAAARRMKMVIGIVAMVSANSGSSVLVTMTTNWTMKPRKKKKSNLRSAM
jgi:hypothetical protein